MRSFVIALTFAIGMALCPIAAPVFAADEPTKILDSTISKYRDSAKQWEPVLKVHAKRLFLILCVISLVFTAGWGFLRGNMGIGDFFSEFVRFGITMGIFYWLLENGPSMAKAIIDSMTLMGQEASSTYVVQLTPSDICTQGFGILYDAVAEFGKSDYSTGILVIVLALVVAVVFGVIAAQMVVLLCSSWILIYGGVFYLGFGGGNWTSDIAKNYFKTILAQAMQVFTFCLLIGIGQTEIYNLTSSLRTTKSVTVANYWYMFGVGGGSPTKVVETETLTLASMCVCLVFAVILVILVSKVPGLVAGIITGSSITAMAFGGVGGAMSSASGLVSGGAMMAAQASGAGLALATAYKQAVANLDPGDGVSSVMSSSGGLTGAMSSGLAFAYEFASNLASGSAGSVKDGLQQSTVGGRISAIIEADAQIGGGNGNETSENGKGGDTNPKAEASGDMDAENSVHDTGNGASMDKGLAQPNSGLGNSNADSDGVLSQENEMENRSGVGSSVASGAGSLGNIGGSMSDDPVFDGGGISSGAGSIGFNSEWDDAIANYDPKNVGRPDEESNSIFGGDKAWNDAIANYDPKNIGLPDDS